MILVVSLKREDDITPQANLFFLSMSCLGHTMSYPTKILAMSLTREDDIGPQANLISRRLGSSKAIPLKSKALLTTFQRTDKPARAKEKKRTCTRGVQCTFSTTGLFPDVKFLCLEMSQNCLGLPMVPVSLFTCF